MILNWAIPNRGEEFIGDLVSYRTFRVVRNEPNIQILGILKAWIDRIKFILYIVCVFFFSLQSFPFPYLLMVSQMLFGN